MSKHTPGPWCREWIAGALRHICRNCDWEVFMHERPPEDANTPTYLGTNDVDLIWTAPELLAACKAALRIEKLWLPLGTVSAEHVEEARALCEMRQKFITAIAQVEGTK